MKPLQTKPKKVSFWSKLSTASLDFNGSPFNLEFASKNGKFQTKFGGYLSLIISFTVILTFILSVSQLFSDNSPVVNITPVSYPDEMITKLYDEDLVMPLMFKKGKKLISSPEELSKYFTVKTFAVQRDFDAVQSRFLNLWVHDFPLILCSQVREKNQRIKNSVNQLFEHSQSLKKYTFCPDLGDKTEFFRLSTARKTLVRTNIYVRFYPCSLSDASQCATAAELDDMEVFFYSNKKVVDASNFDEPVKYTPQKNKLKVDRSARRILTYYFDTNVIVDDSTQIRPSKTRARFSTGSLEGIYRRSRDPSAVYCSPEVMSLGYYTKCSYIFESQWASRSNLIKIRRSYKKASAMLAEFGGYLKLLMTVTFFIYSIRASKRMKKYLAETIMPHFYPKESQILSTKKTLETSVLSLIKSRSDVRDFQRRISLLDFLKNRYMPKTEENSQTNIPQSAPSKNLNLNQKHANITTSNLSAAILESPTNYSSLSEAYQNIKTASMVPSSNVKKVINLYFLDLLKRDFEVDS